MEAERLISEVIMRLVETGGRTSQDFGVGRIVGQILVYLYLQEQSCSLDKIGEDLGLSKASVSIAVRQLEQLGLAKKVWKKGDRKNYYRSADNIATALQNGILSLLRQKVELFGNELDDAIGLLNIHNTNDDKNSVEFLQQRIRRARKLQGRLKLLLSNPLVRLLSSEKQD